MKKSRLQNFMKDYLMLFVLIALIVIFSVLGPVIAGRSFFNLKNLLTMLNQNAYLIIIGVGITFIMLGGGMDLSTGYLLSTVGMLMVIAMKNWSLSWIIAVVIGIAAGFIISAFNGAVYAWLRVFPFIITLGTQYILNGVTYLLTGGTSLTFNVDGVFKAIGGTNIRIFDGSLKTGVIVMIVMVAIGSFILNKTYFGRNIYAMGSNPDAVELSGVSVSKMRFLIFAVAGLFFAVAILCQIGSQGAMNQSTGVGAEFTVMAGAMLGGIKMGGGGGKMSNMVIGVLIIGVLDYGMTFLNINQYWKDVVLGIALLAAIAVDTLQTRAAIKAAKKVTGQAPAA
ncbi:MAG: ABC transporter permease [Parasporobacterium sp.]|nr:ABC transporter permease [Parasporobacterium sp.]